MRHRLLLPALAFGVLGLVACENDATQPSAAEEQSPGAPDLAVASNTWISRRDMPFEWRDMAVADVLNAQGQSILYALGGSTARGAPLGRVRAYNVATNTWHWKPDMPIAVGSTNGAAVLNGKIYVSGGVTTTYWPTDGYLSNALLVYDPVTNIWSQKQRMPEDGAWGVTGVIKGKLYVVTTTLCVVDGDEAFERCDRSKMFRYNPVTDRWAKLPRPRRAYSMGAVLYDKLYVTDGEKLEMYDPATNQWVVQRSGPQVQWEGAAAALNGKLYVTGGRAPGVEALRTTSVYRPLSDSWTTAAPLPTARTGVAAIRVYLNGRPRLEVVGGSLPGNNVQYAP